MDNIENKEFRKRDRHGYIFPDENIDKIQELECEVPIDALANDFAPPSLFPSDVGGMPELILETQNKETKKIKNKGKFTRKSGILKWILATLILLLVATAILVFYWVECRNVKLITFKGEQRLMVDVTPEKFVDMYENLTVTFIEDQHKNIYTYKDLGIKVKWSDSQKTQFEEFEVNLDNMYIYFNYSPELKKIVHSLNDSRKDWLSATFEETGDAFVVTKEQKGNKVDIEAIEQYLISNFAPADLVIDLNDFKIQQPEDWTTDIEYRNEVLKWESFYILYSSGFEITKEDVKPFFKLTEDYKIVFDESKKDKLNEQIWEWINKDLDSYNTLGGKFKFLTSGGQEVELKGVNYGDKINKEKEHAFLTEVITNLWTCPSRIPEMSIDYPDDIQSNVIEISLEDQHLWYWRDGQVHMDTDIVTGWKNKWDTPTGVYRVLNKIDGVYLIGDDYKTWVDKWMRFWNGYGLHDATWRNKFGGTIYKKDGSHGCINLPHSFAVKLYDMVEPGDCVVIY